MKRGGGVHTVPASDGTTRWWNVRNGKILSRHRDKEVAIAAGRQVAKEMQVEHSIHRADGVITEANSYGNDPRTIRG